MDIEYRVDGFVKDAAYRLPIQDVAGEFQQSFPGANRLNLTVHEIPYPALGLPRQQTRIVISDDKSEVKVNVDVQKYYNNKGKITSTPEPFDVCTDVRHQLQRASEKFNK